MHTHYGQLDYCAGTGIDGFSCPSEQKCVPQEYRCDGVPDCGSVSSFSDLLLAIDELTNCTGRCTITEVCGCIMGDIV